MIFAAFRAYLFSPLEIELIFWFKRHQKYLSKNQTLLLILLVLLYIFSQFFIDILSKWLNRPPPSSKKKVSFYHWIHLPYPDTSKILNFCYSTQNFIFLVVRKTKKSIDWKLSLFTLKVGYSVGQKTFFLTYFNRISLTLFDMTR